MITQTSNRPPAEVISRVDGIAATLRLLADSLADVSDAIPTNPDPTRVDELVDVLDELAARITRLGADPTCPKVVAEELADFVADLIHAVALADGLPR